MSILLIQKKEEKKKERNKKQTNKRVREKLDCM